MTRTDGLRARRRMLAVLVAFVSGAAFVVVGPAAVPAYACDCSLPSDAEAFEWSDAVFVGELVGYEPPPAAAVMSSADPATWVFEVSEVYKGEVFARQEIVSEVSGASCGLEIPQQGEFLVFATDEGWQMEVAEGEYYAGLCGGTRSSSAGPLDLAVDSSPPLPVPAADTPESTTGFVRVAVAAAVGLAVVVVVVVAVALRRRGRHAQR